MKIIGHRGASGYEPENTLASFKKALNLGVDIIEMDVFALKTGEVIVLHDDTVDRTTDGTGHISEFSFKQLRRLDAGGGQKIPLLTEVLDMVDKKVLINIEIKGVDTAKPVADIINHYTSKKGWTETQFLVSSFNHNELNTFVKLCPAIQVGVLFEVRPTTYSVLDQNHAAYSANLDATFITDTNVREAHSRGMKVFAYTVNSRHEAERMEALKVDGIFTNYPDKVAPRVAVT